jgi:uncharacterized membrane protein YfcA
MILFLLIAVAIYTWLKPDLGKLENLRHVPKQRIQIGALAGAVIGFYDGIFGPGTKIATAAQEILTLMIEALQGE